MKKIAFVLTLSLSVWAAGADPSEQVEEIIIGLSPFQTAGVRSKQEAAIKRFVLSDCPNGSPIVVWDAWELKIICELRLPKLAYDSAIARAPHVAPALIALKNWGTELDGKPPPADLKGSAAIRFPEWLQAASAEAAAKPSSIVVLASPFYISPGEPSFSMIDSRYPADGHLNVTAAESLYGIADKRDRLKNRVVLWAYESESIWSSERHHQAVSRWWAVFVAGQGGRLCAFSSDMPQVLSAATRPSERAIGQFSLNGERDGLVMLTAAKREVPLKVESPKPAPSPEIAPTTSATPTVKTSPPPTTPVAPLQEKVSPDTKSELPEKPAQPEAAVIKDIPVPRSGNVGIAAIWKVDGAAGATTDLDLYVATEPGQPEAFWKRPKTPRVEYFRDIRQAKSANDSDRWRESWEYVEVENAELGSPAKAPTCWLNVYRSSSRVHGFVRVQFNGKIVDRPFQFDVRRGNAGRDSDPAARTRSPYWLRIDLTEFFANQAKK